MQLMEHSMDNSIISMIPFPTRTILDIDLQTSF
jgi:hypothetical protein